MSSSESAQRWLEKGAEAYADMRLDEAAQYFRKSVEVDPHSAKAHLCLGVIYIFKSLNESGGLRPLTPAQIAEQNATNGPSAEEHLKKALELEPHDEQAMEYLGLLYFWWRDPATERWARRDDALRWYARILEIDPRHRFANYLCGIVDYDKAFPIIRSTPGFPRPLADEERRRSLRGEVGPLLKESAASFLRSLELNPNSLYAMTYLGDVRSDEAYVAESTDESARLGAEASEWYRKVWKIMEADAKATGQPWPPGDTASITFDRIPGKAPIPPFPPDPRFMVPPAGPPPLPPAGPGR